MTINDDAVHWAVDGEPATAAEARTALTTRPLIILMHGYGSFEGDLIGLAPQLPTNFVCASPRAPLTAPAPVVNGFSWFPIPFTAEGIPVPRPEPEHFVGSDAHTAATAMLQWIDTLNERVDGGLGRIALMGFSQGGAMVTSLLRLRPERFTAGVNCSGFVAGGAHPADTALAAIRPPTFWGYDPADPIVTEARIAYTHDWLPAHTTLETRTYPGIAHSISREEVADIHRFLTTHVLTGATS